MTLSPPADALDFRARINRALHHRDGAGALALALAMRARHSGPFDRAWSLWAEGAALAELERTAEALVAYDAAIACCGDSPKLELRACIAQAMLGKAELLARTGCGDAAVLLYDEVVAAFGAAEDVELLEPAAEALFLKGAMLGGRGRDADAAALYDEVIARFDICETIGLRLQVARSLVNRGAALERLGRPDEALANYEALLARETDEDEALLAQAAMARNNIALLAGT